VSNSNGASRKRSTRSVGCASLRSGKNAEPPKRSHRAFRVRRLEIENQVDVERQARKTVRQHRQTARDQVADAGALERAEESFERASFHSDRSRGAC
jgi:hypothetical protein